jgi:hypothetical protein
VKDILEKLEELLAANAIVQGDLRIANQGDLEVAKDLVATGDDDPEVTIQGNLYVLINDTNGLKDSLAAVNKITNKIRIVQKTVTVTTNSAIELNALTYVAGNYNVGGVGGSVADKKLRTINGDMTIDLGGDLDYPKLNSVGSGGVTISQNSTVTSVDFGGLVSGKVLTGTGSITLPNATSVKVAGVLPAVVHLDKATHFESNYVGSAQTTTTITVGGANATFKLGATKFTGLVSITTKGDVNLPQLTESKALYVKAGSGATIDLSSITKITGATTLSATTVKLDMLKTASADITLDGPTSVKLDNLETSTGAFVAAAATSFEAPKLSTTSGTVDLKAGAKVTVKNIADAGTPANDILDWATIKDLTLAGQEGNLILTAAVSLTTLNFTGKKASPVGAGNQSNTLSITQDNKALSSLAFGSDSALGTLTVSSSVLKTLKTDGVIINVVVKGNKNLESFEFEHSHLDGDNATTISITDNEKITSIDLSSLAKVKEVVITGNASLTTIKAPSTNPLAEPIATVTVTINNNDTRGTYKPAKAPTETTKYESASATATVVSSFKTFIEAYLAQTRTSSVTYSIDVDKVDKIGTTAVETATLSATLSDDDAAKNGPDGTSGNTDDQTDGGAVSTKNEFALFD